MMLVSTTGFILVGPYFADDKNNDASILTTHMKSTAKSLESWLHKDNLIIVDRVFRDWVDWLIITYNVEFLSTLYRGLCQNCMQYSQRI